MRRRLRRWLLLRIHALTRAAEQAGLEEWQCQALAGFGRCGTGVVVSGRSHFIHPERIRLGDNVHLGRNAWLRGDGGIEIGDNTHISRNVAIFSASHDHRGSRLPYDDGFVLRPVRIGRNVWIGMNAMLIPGVSLGDGAIVGMGTVVTGDVPPLAIVGGPGHRILGHRDREHYEKLEREGRWGGRGGAALP